MGTDKIKISLLGRFEIRVNNHLALRQLNQSKKTRRLIEYLILKKGLPAAHEELYNVLWHDNKRTDPGTALRTLLYRLRIMLQSQNAEETVKFIITGKGSYCWNTELDCELDIYVFERLINEAGNEGKNTYERINLYQQAFSLYNRELLEEENVINADFILYYRKIYHNLYINAVYKCIALMADNKQHNQIIQVCRKALEFTPADKYLNVELIKALNRSGRSREALSQYNAIIGWDKSWEALGKEINLVYQESSIASEMERVTSRNIMAEIEGSNISSGPYVWDYDVFKEHYFIQKNLHERINIGFSLILLTLNNTMDVQWSIIEQYSFLNKLLSIMKKSLRKGDMIARYSPKQLVALLPLSDAQVSNTVMERIKKKFCLSCGNSSIILNYTCQEWIPDNDKTGGIKDETYCIG